MTPRRLRAPALLGGLLVLAASLSACSASRRVRAGIYQGLATSSCRAHEGDDYPDVQPCPQGDFEAYDAAREEHLAEIRAERERDTSGDGGRR